MESENQKEKEKEKEKKLSSTLAYFERVFKRRLYVCKALFAQSYDYRNCRKCS